MVAAGWVPFEPPYRNGKPPIGPRNSVMTELLQALEDHEGNEQEGKIVSDTTGSVIYTASTTSCGFAPYHHRSPRDTSEIQQKMLEAYMKQPRPILWRDLFHRLPDETNVQAMARCYPLLLASREDQYRKLAHVTISYYHHRRPGFTVQDFLGAVSSARDQR